MRRGQTTRVELPCTYCKTPTLFYPWRIKNAKQVFCCRDCRTKYRGNNPAMHPCTSCGILILRSQQNPHNPRPFFCSKQCQWDFHKRPLAERFWEKVDASGGPDMCWPWTGTRNRKGYGQFAKKPGKVVPAHVMAYELTYESLPEGLQGLHHCDNPPCCNPQHIFPGTNTDNMQDCVQKKRHCYGIKHPHAKLTDPDIVEILHLKGIMFCAAIAARFNVSDSTVSRIWTNQIWRHIPRN